MKFFRTYQYLATVSELQVTCQGLLLGAACLGTTTVSGGYILGEDLPRILSLSCNRTWRGPDWLAKLRADDLVQVWATALSERRKGLDNVFQAHSAFSEPGNRLRSTAATLPFSRGL